MSIKIVETHSGEYVPKTKLMVEMSNGEVCKMVSGGENYILKLVTMDEPVYMIIGDKIGNTYCGRRITHQVRSLYPNENIVVEFS